MAMIRFAWTLGALGMMILGVFCTYAWRVQDVALISTGWLTLGGTGLALVGLWLWLDWQLIMAFSRARAAKQASSALVFTAMATAIAVTANMLASKHDKRWDLTSTNRYQLSEQTISVVQGLTSQVEVLGFFVGEPHDLASFRDLIAGLKTHTDQLVFSKHDPVLSPRLAEQYAIVSSAGTVVLRQGDNEQRIEGEFDEQALVNALIRLSSPVEHQICTVTGHGEMEPDGPHLSAVVIQLERQNYTFTTTNLLADGGVPSHCEVLLFADPETEWLPPEREMLAAYVVGGGQVIGLMNPERTHELSADMGRYGLKLQRDVVLEANPNLKIMNGDASFLVIPASSMADHPITTPIRSTAIMRMARTVEAANPSPEGLKTQTLIHTSTYAWAETDLDSTEPPTPDEGTDRIGKVPVASIAEVTDPQALPIGPRTLSTEVGAVEPAIARREGGRVLIFGDADFTTNELLGMGSNLDLLQNAIAWMVGEQDQVSIRPNEAAQSTLVMNQIQEVLLWLLTVLILPGLCTCAALGTWLARRRL